MRRGGLLDGFPLHLLTRNQGSATVLVLDRPELGPLQMGPECHPARIIAVSRSLDCLRETATQQRRVHLVCADPLRLPLRDRSLDGVVLSRRFENESDRELHGIPAEIGRTLRPDGWLASFGAAPAAESRSDGVVRSPRRYSIQPASGREYFIVPAGGSATWLLKQLQIGRVQAARAALGRILRWCGLRSGTVSAAIYSAGKPSGLLRRWVEVDRSPAGESRAESFGLFVKAGWNAVLLNRNPDRPVVKFPLSTAVRLEMQKHARTLDELRSASIPALANLIPRVVESGSIDSQVFHAESCCPGTVATKLWWKPSRRRQAVESAIEFLARLHLETRKSGALDRTTFDGLLADSLRTIEGGVGGFERGFSLDPLAGKLWSFFGGKVMPLVRSHGDFWAGNLLVSAGGVLTGVLDWGRSADRDWPVVDLIHLIACQRKWRAIWRFGALVLGKLLPCELSRWERAAIQRYFDGLGIDLARWPGFVVIYWLKRTSQLIEQKVSFCDESWLRRNFLQALPGIIEGLGKVR